VRGEQPRAWRPRCSPYTPKGYPVAEARQAIVNPIAQDLLKKRGLNYTIEYNIAASDITRPREGTQIRDPKHQAPPANVRSYAAAMSTGSKFPAVVVDREGMLLDGNTRRAAAEKSGTVLNVIRITDELGLAETKLLQTALNNTNGERLSKEETRAVVVDIVESGVGIDIGAVAVATSYPKNTIGRWAKAAEFVQRARSVGTDPSPLNEGTRVQLNKLQSNEFIPSAVALVTDANLSLSDIGELVKVVNDASVVSAGDAHTKITTLRDVDYKDRIRETASGLRRPSAMAKHQMHLKYIEGTINVDDIRDAPVATLDGFIETFDAVIDKLTAMRSIAVSRRPVFEEHAA
jgi:hypothetical protein